MRLLKYSLDFKNNWLDQISQNECAEYGEGNFRTPEQLKDFAENHPKGFVAIVEDAVDKIVGAVDWYPLKSDVWHALAEGVMREEDLKTEDIQHDSAWIYIASVIVLKSSRSSFVGTPMMFRALMRQVWKSLAKKDETLHVLGVGSTEKGRILLNNWGFEKIEGSPQKIDFRTRFTLHDLDASQSKKLAEHYKQN